MATSSSDAYKKLNKTSQSTTGKNAKQLVFPPDYVSTISDHSPHCVVLSINTISGNSVTPTISGLQNNTGAIVAAESSEVVMQNTANASVRSKQTSASSVGINTSIYKRTDESIVLPMPTNLQLSDQANWSNADLGALGRLIDYGKAISENDVTNGMMSDVARRGVADIAAKKLGTGDELTNMLQLTTGAIQNSYNEVLFKNMSNRVIPMSWTLVANNQQDSELIQAVIHRLRYHQRPSLRYNDSKTNISSFLTVPSTFDISLIDLTTGKHIEGIPKISTCALVDISVVYSTGNKWVTTTNGNPLSVTINLTFMELTLGTKNMMTDIQNSF